MASIKECVRYVPPTGNITGSEIPRYEATWRVVVDDKIPYVQVLDLCSRIPQAGTQYPIPRRGDAFKWKSPGGRTWIDGSAFALDFRGEMAQPMDGFNWLITVTWRRPTPGQDEEPGQIGKPPLQRSPEYWIQYYTTTEEITEGRNIIGIGRGGLYTRNPFTLGPLTTSAAERTQAYYKDRLKAVLVVQRNVRSPRDALRLNNRFEDTINISEWRTPFQRVRRHHARFMRAETSQQVTEDNFRYWRMRVMVEIARTPYYVNVPNRGTLYLEAGNDLQQTFRDPDGAIQEFNLRQNGTLFGAATPITIPYLVQREAEYNTLPF